MTMMRIHKLIPLCIMLICAFTGVLHGEAFSASSGPEGIEWRLVEVGGAPVSPLANEKQPYIMFDPPQKRVSGFAGCNNFFGSYELDGSSLKFGPIGSTRRACPDRETAVETEVFKALDKTRAWKIKDGMLLLLDDSAVLARFTRAQTLYNDDRRSVPPKPANYTVQFLKNGRVNVKADCNLKGGVYSTDGKRLSIEITHSTMAACEEGSLEEQFVRDLTAGALFFLKEGDLYIDLKYDTGTMKFSKQEGE
jgi:heat shock protein HslJ